MSYRLRTRSSRNKKTLSDKFEIGAGRYVHDLEVPFTPQDDLSLISATKSVPKATVKENSVENSNLKLSSSLSEKDDSLSAQRQSCLGRYVHDVEFSQLEDLSVSSTHESLGYSENSPSSEGLSPSLSSVFKEHNAKASNPVNMQLTSNVAHGSIKSKNMQKQSPNFTKMHQEYKLAWRKNPTPNSTRPMRLMEFIFSHCDGKKKDTKEDESDDSMDIALKKAKDKRGKPTSQLLAELDMKYEAERAKNTEYFQKLSDYLDESSNKSKSSRKSVVGSSVQLKVLCSEDHVIHDDLSSSSESSHGVNESVNSNYQSLTEVTAMNTNSVSPLNKTNPYNKIISISNQLHIPDGFSILYYSSDSDAVKVKQLNEFNGYVTDQLKEEMSKFYPKCEDVITDQSTNDISMNKQTFTYNFSQIFRKGRIFLNYVQLREAVS